MKIVTVNTIINQIGTFEEEENYKILFRVTLIFLHNIYKVNLIKSVRLFINERIYDSKAVSNRSIRRSLNHVSN